MSESIAFRLRAKATEESTSMCCLGTGECGIDDCRSDSARLGGLDDAADWVAEWEAELRDERDQALIRAEAAEQELADYRRNEHVFDFGVTS